MPSITLAVPPSSETLVKLTPATSSLASQRGGEGQGEGQRPVSVLRGCTRTEERYEHTPSRLLAFRPAGVMSLISCFLICKMETGAAPSQGPGGVNESLHLEEPSVHTTCEPLSCSPTPAVTLVMGRGDDCRLPSSPDSNQRPCCEPLGKRGTPRADCSHW